MIEYLLTSLFFWVFIIICGNISERAVEFEGCFSAAIGIILFIGWIVYTVRYFF